MFGLKKYIVKVLRKSGHHGIEYTKRLHQSPANEKHATNDQHCSDDVSFSLTEDTILLIGVSIVNFVSKNEEYSNVRKRYEDHRNYIFNENTDTNHNLQRSRTNGWIKAALTPIDCVDEEKPKRISETEDPRNTH